MPTYKEQLLAGLIARGWEQVEVDVEGVGWWADEHWRIRSTREARGLELVLTFLVDPTFDAPRRKGRGIRAVAASPDMPREPRDVLGGIELCMYKGRFDEKLAVFLDELDEHRRRVRSPERGHGLPEAGSSSAAYHPHRNEKTLDRAIARFASSHMSDAKWVRLLKALTSAPGLVTACRVKLVWDSRERAFRLHGRSTYGFDFYDHAVEGMIDGVADGWVMYREIEWIDFPAQAIVWVDEDNRSAGTRTVPQDLEAIHAVIARIGTFEVSRTSTGLRLYGYR